MPDVVVDARKLIEALSAEPKPARLWGQLAQPGRPTLESEVSAAELAAGGTTLGFFTVAQASTRVTVVAYDGERRPLAAASRGFFADMGGGAGKASDADPAIELGMWPKPVAVAEELAALDRDAGPIDRQAVRYYMLPLASLERLDPAARGLPGVDADELVLVVELAVAAGKERHRRLYYTAEADRAIADVGAATPFRDELSGLLAVRRRVS